MAAHASGEGAGSWLHDAGHVADFREQFQGPVASFLPADATFGSSLVVVLGTKEGFSVQVAASSTDAVLMHGETPCSNTSRPMSLQKQCRSSEYCSYDMVKPFSPPFLGPSLRTFTGHWWHSTSWVAFRMGFKVGCASNSCPGYHELTYA